MPARNDAVLITEPFAGRLRSMTGMPCLQLSQVVVRLPASTAFQVSRLVVSAEWSAWSIRPALLWMTSMRPSSRWMRA